MEVCSSRLEDSQAPAGGRAQVVMVGLVPPPFHGQSIITKALFESDLRPIRSRVVEARFNQEIGQVSRFEFRKLLELFRVIGRCLDQRRRSGAALLYYTPGSAKLVPFLKDVVLLVALRPFFKRTLLHYHSGGLPEFLRRRWWTRGLGRLAYGRGAWAIALTGSVPVPGLEFGAAREIVIPNGIKGAPAFAGEKTCWADSVFTVVFLGNLYREKGILDALSACVAAARRLPRRRFCFSVAGGEPEAEVGRAIAKQLDDCPDNLNVELVGTLDAAAKWAFLGRAHVMLFPSYYSSENFPLVLLEAMACGVPIVASRWRGIPSIVEPGETGFLAEVGEVDALERSLVTLADDAELLQRMSRSARRAFEEHYDWPKFEENVRSCLERALET